MGTDSERARRKRLALLSFEEKIKILERLRERSKAIAAAGLRKQKEEKRTTLTGGERHKPDNNE